MSFIDLGDVPVRRRADLVKKGPLNDGWAFDIQVEDAQRPRWRDAEELSAEGEFMGEPVQKDGLSGGRLTDDHGDGLGGKELSPEVTRRVREPTQLLQIEPGRRNR